MKPLDVHGATGDGHSLAEVPVLYSVMSVSHDLFPPLVLVILLLVWTTWIGWSASQAMNRND